LRLDRLDADHDAAGFESGNQELDGWLRRHALAAHQMDSARTFVLTENASVVGYFSLTMGSVLRADAPAKLVRGLPAYPIGIVLLARLAIDRRYQGQGLGVPRCSPRHSAGRSPLARPLRHGCSSSTPSTTPLWASTDDMGSSTRRNIPTGSSDVSRTFA